MVSKSRPGFFLVAKQSLHLSLAFHHKFEKERFLTMTQRPRVVHLQICLGSYERRRSNTSQPNPTEVYSPMAILGLKTLFLKKFTITRLRLTCSVKCFKIPLNEGRAEQRTISAQDLSVSQSEAGFGNLFSRATPPVSKNRHSCSSILPLEKNKKCIKATNK